MDTIFIGAKQAAAATTARRMRRRRLRKGKKRGKEEGSLITSEGKGKPAMVTVVVLQSPPPCNWALLRAKGERGPPQRGESSSQTLSACLLAHSYVIHVPNSNNQLVQQSLLQLVIGHLLLAPTTHGFSFFNLKINCNCNFK
jgi:hypothetical protein